MCKEKLSLVMKDYHYYRSLLSNRDKFIEEFIYHPERDYPKEILYEFYEKDISYLFRSALMELRQFPDDILCLVLDYLIGTYNLDDLRNFKSYQRIPSSYIGLIEKIFGINLSPLPLSNRICLEDLEFDITTGKYVGEIGLGLLQAPSCFKSLGNFEYEPISGSYVNSGVTCRVLYTIPAARVSLNPNGVVRIERVIKNNKILRCMRKN